MQGSGLRMWLRRSGSQSYRRSLGYGSGLRGGRCRLMLLCYERWRRIPRWGKEGRNLRSFVVLIMDEMDFRLELYFDGVGVVLGVLSLNR